jgi:uncharacterized protein (TIGR02147 family)
MPPLSENAERRPLKPTLRIYDYQDYRKYLASYYREAKSLDRLFSHRFVQESVGAASTGWFSDLLKGRINLTGTHLLRLARMLELSPIETDYFESMVAYAQASSLEDKTRYMERMLSFNEVKVDLVGRDKFEYFGKWHHAIIRELLFIHDFTGDYRALAKLLHPAITPAQARHSIALLKRLGFIRLDAAGRFRPSNAVLKKDTTSKSLHLASFLKTNMQLGIEALDRVEREARDISSLALVLSEEDFRRAKEEIKALRKRLLKWGEKTALNGKVYQCNFQIFPVTK